MKLQLALDFGSLDDLKNLASKVGEWVDWIEVGTPLIYQEGVRAVAAFRISFPDKVIVADLKIVDTGGMESEMAFKAGANIVTVLACASDTTITAAVQQARNYHGKIMVDIIGIPSNDERVQKMDALGVDYICYHTAMDDGGVRADLLDDIGALSQTTRLPLVIAGGIDQEMIKKLIPYHPHALIIGRSITNAPDPLVAARQFHNLMRTDLYR